MKSLLQQPAKLKNLALVKLAEWMAMKAEKLMAPKSPQQNAKCEASYSRQIELIRNYLERNMSALLINKLAAETIRALSQLYHKTGQSTEDVSRMIVIKKMLEALFTKNLTCLSLNGYDMKIFGPSLFSKSRMLQNLNDLTIELMPGVSDSSIKEIHVIQLLTELHNLKHLSIDYCTDNILRCLTKNCKLIESLNLNKSNINDNNINIITQLRNLKSVYLYATAISQKGIETILLSCLNIEYIDTDTNYVASAIQHIVSCEKSKLENTGNEFKLKSYTNDEATTREQLQLVVSKCPLIQKVMFTKHLTSQNYLMVLINLQDLHELKLTGYNYNEDEVEELLRIRGQNLVYLHLQRVEQMDRDALMLISNMCPNLQSLVIEKCTFEEQTLRKATVLEITPFINLKTLSVCMNRVRPPTEELLLILLTNCPNVEFVYIGGEHIKQPLSKVFDKNPMMHLKELKIWTRDKSMLSKLIIDRIIKNCINFPEVLIY